MAKTHPRILAGALALLAFALAPNRIAAQSGTIRGCVQQSSGQLRIIGPGDSCRRTEELIEWNAQGPAGPAGPPGPAGPAGTNGKDGATNVATAEQTADVAATRNLATDIVWVPIPGAAATITLAAPGMIDMHALGGVFGRGNDNAYCAFRFVVDGVPQGTPGLYGDRLVGVGSLNASFVPATQAPYWSGWSMLRTLPASAGAHTISLEMTALDNTCQTDARSFGSARLWVLGR